LLDLGTKFEDRFQTVVEYFNLESSEAGKIVEIGCGNAPFFRLAQSHKHLNHLSVVCTDISNEGVSLFSKEDRPPFTLAGPDNLPFKDATMLGAILWDVLEHLDNPRAALKDTARTLVSGGFLHIVCPNPESWQRDSSDPKKDVYRRNESHIFPPIVTAKYLDVTLRELGFKYELFTRGFEGTDIQAQTGLKAMQPASVDSTGTHLIAFARKK
jgi:ubiquinone/menaquinone biosynthesis C-methylase UbiE